MSSSDPLHSPVDVSDFAYVVGIDVGSQAYVYTVCQPVMRPVVKPTKLVNGRVGFEQLDHDLRQLGVAPARILIRLEATSRYNENLYQFLKEQGYALCLLHPGQTHQFAQQRGLRAKTDRLDASTIARVLLSGEARAGYVPDELIATYRELERLHSQLADESARYQNEIQALLVMLFPEFTQVFADPCRPTALALLKRYPSAQAIIAAGVEALTTTLQELAPRHYGRPTAQELVRLATQSAASGRAMGARSLSLQVLCDQLEHTLTNLAQVARELDRALVTIRQEIETTIANSLIPERLMASLTGHFETLVQERLTVSPADMRQTGLPAVSPETPETHTIRLLSPQNVLGRAVRPAGEAAGNGSHLARIYALLNEDRSRKPADLQRLTGIPKATVYRLVERYHREHPVIATAVMRETETQRDEAMSGETEPPRE